eukprot:6190114-Pleurochrysis_carterae.AAC.2
MSFEISSCHVVGFRMEDWLRHSQSNNLAEPTPKPGAQATLSYASISRAASLSCVKLLASRNSILLCFNAVRRGFYCVMLLPKRQQS